MRASILQLFAACVLTAAVEFVTGEDDPGVRAVCGLAVALSAVRAAAVMFQ